MSTTTILIHSCGEQVDSIIAGYLHLLSCPEAPPRQIPAQIPAKLPDSKLMGQLIGRELNPYHRRADEDLDFGLRRVR